MKMIAAPQTDGQPGIERHHLGRTMVAHGYGVFRRLHFDLCLAGTRGIEAEIGMRRDGVFDLAEVVDDELERGVDAIAAGRCAVSSRLSRTGCQ